MLVQQSDEWLMKDVVDGKRDSLDILVRRHAGPLLTFLTRLSGNRHAAEELFQDAFLIVWKKRHLYKTDKPFKAWLYRIAINRSRDLFRKKKLLLSGVDPTDLAEIAAAPDDSGSHGKDQIPRQLIVDAVATLTEQQRLVLVLRIWSHFDYAEIARIAECREATVRSHMSRALESLRTYLETRMREQSREKAQ